MASNYGIFQVAPNNGYVFTNASNNDIVLYNTSTSNQILIGAQSNNYASIATSASNMALTAVGSTNSNFKFNTYGGASNVLTLGTGMMGVANSNPQYTLDVGGNINFTGSMYYNGAFSLGKVPIFSAYISSATNIGSNVPTLIGFQTADFDTNGCYNNTGSTTTLNGLSVPAYSFCPNIAGYYMVIASGVVCAAAINSAYYSLTIYKNGAANVAGGGAAANGLYVNSVSGTVYLNGTGDYVNIYANQYGPPSSPTSVFNWSKFQAAFVCGTH